MGLGGSRWVGVDGCKAGWFAVGCLEDGRVKAAVYASMSELSAACSGAYVAIDIPIGLPDTGRRACEATARQLLGLRASSVFPTPVRDCLSALDSYERASALSMARIGKKLSKQTFAILPKIAEVDRCLRADATLAAHVYEVHPEVCFADWAGGQPARHGKKTGLGFAERLLLVDAAYPGEVARIRERFTSRQVADDDILDAFAALRTAERLAKGKAHAIDQREEFDGHGLRMTMWV